MPLPVYAFSPFSKISSANLLLFTDIKFDNSSFDIHFTTCFLLSFSDIPMFLSEFSLPNKISNVEYLFTPLYSAKKWLISINGLWWVISTSVKPVSSSTSLRAACFGGSPSSIPPNTKDLHSLPLQSTHKYLFWVLCFITAITLCLFVLFYQLLVPLYQFHNNMVQLLDLFSYYFCMHIQNLLGYVLEWKIDFL